MKEREKLLVAILVFIASLMLLTYILLFAMNFADIKLRFYANAMMQGLKNKNYEIVYNAFRESYGETLQQFIIQQDTVNSLVGDMESYQLKSVKHLDQTIQTTYAVKYAAFPEITMDLKWVFVRQGRDYKISGLTIQTDQQTYTQIATEIKKPLAGVVSGDNATSADAENAVLLAERVIQEMQKGNYRSVYVLGNEDFQGKGEEVQFSRYLSSIFAKYGTIVSATLVSKEKSGDGNEFRLSYRILCEKSSGEIGLMVWVRKAEKESLSGIRFYESSW